MMNSVAEAPTSSMQNYTFGGACATKGIRGDAVLRNSNQIKSIMNSLAEAQISKKSSSSGMKKTVSFDTNSFAEAQLPRMQNYTFGGASATKVENKNTILNNSDQIKSILNSSGVLRNPNQIKSMLKSLAEAQISKKSSSSEVKKSVSFNKNLFEEAQTPSMQNYTFGGASATKVGNKKTVLKDSNQIKSLLNSYTETQTSKKSSSPDIKRGCSVKDMSSMNRCSSMSKMKKCSSVPIIKKSVSWNQRCELIEYSEE